MLLDFFLHPIWFFVAVSPEDVLRVLNMPCASRGKVCCRSSSFFSVSLGDFCDILSRSSTALSATWLFIEKMVCRKFAVCVSVVEYLIDSGFVLFSLAICGWTVL